eukprot:5064732-Pyramimonas_sp.AAC.1
MHSHLDANILRVKRAPQHSAHVLWDVSNYYEHIGSVCLAQRAVAPGCPCCLLRIIAYQYGSTRFVAMLDARVNVGKSWVGGSDCNVRVGDVSCAN